MPRRLVIMHHRHWRWSTIKHCSEFRLHTRVLKWSSGVSSASALSHCWGTYLGSLFGMASLTDQLRHFTAQLQAYNVSQDTDLTDQTCEAPILVPDGITLRSIFLLFALSNYSPQYTVWWIHGGAGIQRSDEMWQLRCATTVQGKLNWKKLSEEATLVESRRDAVNSIDTYRQGYSVLLDSDVPNISTINDTRGLVGSNSARFSFYYLTSCTCWSMGVVWWIDG